MKGHIDRKRGLIVLSLYASGLTYRQIAERYNVTPTRIRQIADQHRRYLRWEMFYKNRR